MKVNPENVRSYSQVVAGRAEVLSSCGRTWAEMVSNKIPIATDGQPKRKTDLYKQSVYPVLNQKISGQVSRNSADAVTQCDKTGDQLQFKGLTNETAITSRITKSYADKLKKNTGMEKIKEPEAESINDAYIKIDSKQKCSRSVKASYVDALKTPLKQTRTPTLETNSTFIRKPFYTERLAKVDKVDHARRYNKSVISYADVLKVKQDAIKKKVNNKRHIQVKIALKTDFVDKACRQQRVKKDVDALWAKYAEKDGQYEGIQLVIIREKIEAKIGLMMEVNKEWGRLSQEVMDGTGMIHGMWSKPFNRMKAMYLLCFNTIFYELKGYLQKTKELNEIQNPGRKKTGKKRCDKKNKAWSNPDRSEWLSVYQYAWALRKNVFESRSFGSIGSPSDIIKGCSMEQLDDFLKHILSEHVLLLINNEKGKGPRKAMFDALFAFNHYQPLIQCFGNDSNALLGRISMNYSNGLGEMWGRFDRYIVGDNPEKAFDDFDKYVCQNSDIITPRWVDREFENCKYKIKMAIVTVIRKELSLDKKKHIANLCKKFSKKGWLAESYLRFLLEWSESKMSDISITKTCAVKDKTAGRKTEPLMLVPSKPQLLNESNIMSWAIIASRQKKYIASSSISGNESGATHEKKSCESSSKKDSCEKVEVIKPENVCLSIEDLLSNIEFNVFSNRAINNLAPTANLLRKLLNGDKDIYKKLMDWLRKKKESDNDKNNQQILARGWLTILSSDNLIGKLRGMSGQKECESIFVCCICRLFDEADGLFRQDPTKEKYYDFLSNNNSLLQSTLPSLMGIVQSGFEKPETYSFLENNLKRLLADFPVTDIHIGDKNFDKEQESLDIVLMGDVQDKEKSDKNMISESEPSCSMPFGKHQQSNNELVNKKDDRTAIASPKKSWADIIKRPVSERNKIDVKHEVQADKASHGIHNLKSEASAQGKDKDVCVIKPSMKYTPTQEIVDKLEFDSFVTTIKVKKNIAPIKDNVFSLLEGDEEIFERLKTHLKCNKTKAKEIKIQKNLAREWLLILVSHDLISNISNVKGRDHCVEVFLWCSRCFWKEARDSLQSYSSGSEYHKFLSINAKLIQDVQDCLSHLLDLNLKKQNCEYLINELSKFIIDIPSECNNIDDNASDKLNSLLPELLLNDGNGKDKTDKEMVSGSESSDRTSCTVIPVQNNYSDNEQMSKSVEESTTAQEIKTWAQMVKPSVISENNTVDIKYDADHSIQSIKTKPLTEAQKRVIQHAIQETPVSLPVTLVLENVSENESHAIEQNKGLSVGSHQGLMFDTAGTSSPVNISLDQPREESSSPLVIPETDCIKEDLTSVANRRGSLSALDAIQDSSYCESVYKKFGRKNEENNGKAVVFLPQLVTELLQDKPIANKHSMVNLIFRLTFIYLEKAKERILSFASEDCYESKDGDLLDLKPVRDVVNYLRTKYMLTSEIDLCSCEAIIEDIEAMEGCYQSRVPFFVIERLNDLFSVNQPDLGEVCKTLRVGVFLDFRNDSYLRSMLDSSDCRRQMNQILDLLQTLTLHCLFQQKLSIADAKNVRDILKFATKFDDRLSGSVQGENENSSHESLPSNTSDTLGFKKIIEIDFLHREHLITCLQSYISDSGNENALSEKQLLKLNFRMKNIKPIADECKLEEVSKKLIAPDCLHRKPHDGSFNSDYDQILKELNELESIGSVCKPCWDEQFFTSKQAVLYCLHVLSLMEKAIGRHSRHSIFNCEHYHKVLKFCIAQFNKINIKSFFSKDQSIRISELLIKVFSITHFSIKQQLKSSGMDVSEIYHSPQSKSLKTLSENLCGNINEIKVSQFANPALLDKAEKIMQHLSN